MGDLVMELRTRIVGRIRRRAAGRQPPASVGRHDYKTVWTALSGTEDAARFWVQGSTEEAELRRTATYDSQRIVPSLQLTADDDVLEIGCGVGRLGTVLAPVCRTWTGCDVSPRMLEYASRRLEAFPNVRFVEVSGYDLQPVESESVDAVYCTVVFMHLTEWDRYSYVEEAHRILRRGGRLYVDNISLTTDYGWTFFQSSRAFAPTQRPPQIGSTSTPQEFEAYLQHAGFTSSSVEIVDESWVVGRAVK